MSTTCANVFQGLPASCLDGNGILMPKSIILTTLGQQFATKALAGDNSNWLTGIIGQTISPVHGIKVTEDLSGDDAVFESDSQDVIYLFDGKVRMKFSFYVSVDEHKVLRTYSGKKGRAYISDKSNKILGTSPDGAIFQGYKLGYIRVGKLMPATSSTPSFSTLEIQFENTSELNDTLAVIEPSQGTVANRWYPYDLPTLAGVVITQVGTIATNEVIFDVASKSTSVTDNDGTPVTIAPLEGLDVATYLNFLFTDGSAVVAPTGATESATVPGRYTVTFTALVAGATGKIIPSVTQPYSSEVVTFV